jgi:HEAT repeat protein
MSDVQYWLDCLDKTSTQDANDLWGVVEALGLYAGNEAVASALIEKYGGGTGSWALDAAILRALGDIGLPVATHILFMELNNAEMLVRLSAATALGKIGDARAIEPLKQLLAVQLPGHLYWCMVIAKALHALGETGYDEHITRWQEYQAQQTFTVDERVVFTDSDYRMLVRDYYSSAASIKNLFFEFKLDESGGGDNE